MDKKLNNLIEFKEFKNIDKLENKPGKIIESLNNIQGFEDFVKENFFHDTKLGNTIRKGVGFKTDDEKFAQAEEEVMSHVMKRRVYEKLKKENPEKAHKYIEFYVKNPQGFPSWDGTEWIDNARYSIKN